MFLAFAFLILGIFPYLIRRKVAKQMQNSKKLGALVTYEFDDGGITTTTADDSGKVPGVSSGGRLQEEDYHIVYGGKAGYRTSHRPDGGSVHSSGGSDLCKHASACGENPPDGWKEIGRVLKNGDRIQLRERDV